MTLMLLHVTHLEYLCYRTCLSDKMKPGNKRPNMKRPNSNKGATLKLAESLGLVKCRTLSNLNGNGLDTRMKKIPYQYFVVMDFEGIYLLQDMCAINDPLGRTHGPPVVITILT